MSKLLSAILLLPISALGFAAENYEVPRTEWGLPDLQGVWNFSSQTPMLRPSQYGNRQYLTDEEVIELQSRSNALDESSDAAIPGTGVDEAYNDFWIESAGLGRAQLTSHIIYPTNGRLPPLQENAFRTNFHNHMYALYIYIYIYIYMISMHYMYLIYVCITCMY